MATLPDKLHFFSLFLRHCINKTYFTELHIQKQHNAVDLHSLTQLYSSYLALLYSI